mgnify:CR=1 FL=1
MATVLHQTLARALKMQQVAGGLVVLAQFVHPTIMEQAAQSKFVTMHIHATIEVLATPTWLANAFLRLILVSLLDNSVSHVHQGTLLHQAAKPFAMKM